MKFKKTMLAVAAVGAVTASAVPAMALENEFHGMYRLRGFISNFDDSGSGPQSIGNQAGSKTGGKDAPTYAYMEQRARLMYIAKANDDLRLVTHFEFDSRFGDNSYNSNSSFRNSGGGIGADQTNLETKNVFLEFKIPSTPVTVKAGIQGFTDNYKGIIFNNDAAGVVANAKFSAGNIQAAYFRFDDGTGTGTTTNSYFGANQPTLVNNVTGGGASDTVATIGGATAATAPAGSANLSTANNNATVGYNTRDFANIGGKLSISKALTVGADYYLLYSDIFRHIEDKTYVHTVGANAEMKLGPATVNAFGLYQFGKLGMPFGTSAIHTHQNISAWAGNIAARMPIGPGTAKVTLLGLSGDGNTQATGGTRTDFQTIMERGATTSGHTFYEANSQILLRNIYAADKTDRAIVFDLNNNGRGIIAGFAGYDLALGKFFCNSNVGVGAVEHDNNNYRNGSVWGSASGSNVLGTELNTEIGYKLYDNLTASLQGAYFILGGWYDRAGGKPDNPYTSKVMLNYVF